MYLRQFVPGSAQGQNAVPIGRPASGTRNCLGVHKVKEPCLLYALPQGSTTACLFPL